MGNVYMVRYWEDGEEHYEVYQQKKRFLEFINKLINQGIYYELIK